MRSRILVGGGFVILLLLSSFVLAEGDPSSVIWSGSLFGFVGGVVRSLVGILKFNMPKSPQKFKPAYLAFTIVGSGIIGMFAGLLGNGDYRISLLAGYAGIDFIEGIYKIKKRQKTL